MTIFGDVKSLDTKPGMLNQMTKIIEPQSEPIPQFLQCKGEPSLVTKSKYGIAFKQHASLKNEINKK